MNNNLRSFLRAVSLGSAILITFSILWFWKSEKSSLYKFLDISTVVALFLIGIVGRKLSKYNAGIFFLALLCLGGLAECYLKVSEALRTLVNPGFSGVLQYDFIAALFWVFFAVILVLLFYVEVLFSNRK